MTFLKISSIQHYYEKMKECDSEPNQLRNLFSVIVTQFFRDIEQFNYLKNKIFIPYIENYPKKKINVWIPGCATGEEAYSIAVVLQESVKELNCSSINHKIYATDINSEAIEFARKGEYIKGSDQVIESRLDPYKQCVNTSSPMGPLLKNNIIFSEHNLLVDPPLEKMDFICCRNVLIYMKNATQAMVLKKFHMSLKKERFLFLGLSEWINTSSPYFKTLRPGIKIFKAK